MLAKRRLHSHPVAVNDGLESLKAILLNLNVGRLGKANQIDRQHLDSRAMSKLLASVLHGACASCLSHVVTGSESLHHGVLDVLGEVSKKAAKNLSHDVADLSLVAA